MLAWALAAALERLDGLDRTCIARHVQGAEAFLEPARHWTLEEAAAVYSVGAAQTRQLAALYRDTFPAVICPGPGLERNQNGGSGMRAICALPALAGKLGVCGGGILLGASAALPKTLVRLQGNAARVEVARLQ